MSTQAFDSEEEFKSLPEFTLSDKYSYLKRKLMQVSSERNSLESELVKAKIQWAEIELQHENVDLKLKKLTKNHSTLKDEKQALEGQLVQANVELAKALNQIYELQKGKDKGAANQVSLNEGQRSLEESKQQAIPHKESKTTSSRIKRLFKK